MSGVFGQLALLVFSAAAFGIVARHFKQPVVLAYLFAGALGAGLGLFNLSENAESFHLFSDIGITLLLFLVGIEANYLVLRRVGKEALLVGLGQVFITFLLGYGLASLFGFSGISSAYIGLAMTFSSTIIGINLLSEKKDLNSLYGRISVGILLVQDFVAVFALVILTGVGAGTARLENILYDIFGVSAAASHPVFLGTATVFLALLLCAAAFYLSRSFIPKLFDRIARSQDLVFLSSLAWLFAITAISDSIGISKEIGGFLAGVTLANSYEHLEIAQRLKPIRDFFILVFFVVLGASLVVFGGTFSLLAPVVVFSLFVLVGNPIIVLVVMGVMGYPRREAFLTGITIAQISEFSLILAALGLSLGHVSEPEVALITSVGVITFIGSTYLAVHATKIFRHIKKPLAFFERKYTKGHMPGQILFRKPIVVIGFRRTGQSVAMSLPRDDVLVVDHDPEMKEKIIACGFASIFGDMTDDSLWEEIDLKSVRAIISTASDIESSVLVLRELVARRKKAVLPYKIILRAKTDQEAEILYKEGADYVLLPHFSAGRHLAKVVATDPYFQTLADMRRKDQSLMEENVCLA